MAVEALDVAREQWQRSRWWQGHLKAQTRILEQLAPGPLGSAIDIGCGSGNFCLALALAHPGAAVVGIDLDPTALSDARALLATLPGRRPRVVLGDAWSLPAPDGSIDLAAMISVLHWLHPRQREALAEVRRVLRPGGQFLLANMLRQRGVRQYTITLDAFVRETASALGIALSLPPGDLHDRHHTLRSLEVLLRSEGLEPEHTHVWVSRRRYESGAELVRQLEKAMRGYYWTGLNAEEADALRAAIAKRCDASSDMLTRGLPVVNGVVRARRRA